MNLKITGLIVGVVVILGAAFFFLLQQPKSQETPVLSPVSDQTTPAKKSPSSTMKEYADPSGFSFNYPDDLSLVKSEATDSGTYADLKLMSNEVDGSLNLKIQDTKLASPGAWFKENGQTGEAKDVQWGMLNAKSVEDKDKTLFVAVDQGVLFTMEVSYSSQKDFWQAVSGQILSSFAFNSEASQGTTAQSGGSSEEDVTFEGEEVVE